jgi:hypothetical protein
MKMVQEHPHPITMLAEDGSTILVPPGVHKNIPDKFRWNLPAHDRARELKNGARMSVATHGNNVAESSIAKAARLAEEKKALKVPQIKKPE